LGNFQASSLINAQSTSRRNYSPKTKELILSLNKEYGPYLLHKETGITINTIKTFKRALKSTTSNSFEINKRGRKINSPELEIELVAWIRDQRRLCKKISANRMILHARKLAQKIPLCNLKFSYK